MSKRKSCKERNHSECESGWQAKFMNYDGIKLLVVIKIIAHLLLKIIIVKKHTPLKSTDVKVKIMGLTSMIVRYQHVNNI